MKRLLVLVTLVLLLVLAGAARQPAQAHKDYCDTGCWAATEGYIVGCRNHGGTIDQCLGEASTIYYACLCNCRHTC